MPSNELYSVKRICNTGSVPMVVSNLNLYALPIDVIGIEFNPTSGVSQISVNFGDGTIKYSEFTHTYKYPGIYSITINYFLAGLSHTDVLTVTVKNFCVNKLSVNTLTDSIGFTSVNIEEQVTDLGPIYQSLKTNDIVLTRINSWQLYNTDEFGVHLYADGSKSNYFDATSYNKNKYAHLIPLVKFYNKNDEIVDYVKFDTATCIKHYVRNEILNGEVVFVEATESTGVLAYTKNSVTVKFSDDTFTVADANNLDSRVLKFVLDIKNIKNTTDTTVDKNFIYAVEQTNLIHYIHYTVLPVSPDKIEITANGLLDFPLNPIQWTDINIPFTINFSKNAQILKYAKSPGYFTNISINPNLSIYNGTNSNGTPSVDTLSNPEIYDLLKRDNCVSVKLLKYNGTDWVYVENPFNNNYNISENIELNNKVKLGGCFAFGDIIIDGDFTEKSNIETDLNTPKFKLCAEGYRFMDIVRVAPKYLFSIDTYTNKLIKIYKSNTNTDNNQLQPLNNVYVKQLARPVVGQNSYSLAVSIELDRVYVTSPVEKKIYIISCVTGELINTIDTIIEPSHVTLTQSGDVIVCFTDDANIIKYSPNGSIVNQWAWSSSTSLWDSALYSDPQYHGMVGDNFNSPIETDEYNGVICVLFGQYNNNKIQNLSNNLTYTHINKQYKGIKYNPHVNNRLFAYGKISSTSNDIISIIDTLTMTVINEIQVPANIHNVFVDKYNKLWVTHGTHEISVYTIVNDTLTYKLTYTIANSDRIELYNGEETNITGVTCDNDHIWIVDKFNNGYLWAIDIDTPEYVSGNVYSHAEPIQVASINSVLLGTTPNNTIFGECYSNGDWSGIEYTMKYNKTEIYGDTYDVDNCVKLTGESAPFNVYELLDQSALSITLDKVNEDYSHSDTLKNLSIQPALQGNEKLDMYFKAVFGDLITSDASFSKIIYEKIANFVANTNDVDVCNVKFLHSIANEIGYELKNAQLTYPYKVSRILDLVSIKLSKLKGSTVVKSNVFGNKYNLGANIGNRITNATILQHWNITNVDKLVAYEKYSDKFIICKLSHLPLQSGDVMFDMCNSFVPSYTFKLTPYWKAWGWPLVMPTPQSVTYNVTNISGLTTSDIISITGLDATKYISPNSTIVVNYNNRIIYLPVKEVIDNTSIKLWSNPLYSFIGVTSIVVHSTNSVLDFYDFFEYKETADSTVVDNIITNDIQNLKLTDWVDSDKRIDAILQKILLDEVVGPAA